MSTLKPLGTLSCETGNLSSGTPKGRGATLRSCLATSALGISGRPGTVVGCGCWMGIGFDASGAAGGFAGSAGGWSALCCAKAVSATRKTLRVPTSKSLFCLDDRMIIGKSSSVEVIYEIQPSLEIRARGDRSYPILL